jgi:hypothetical protein
VIETQAIEIVPFEHVTAAFAATERVVFPPAA